MYDANENNAFGVSGHLRKKQCVKLLFVCIISKIIIWNAQGVP